MVKTRTLEHRNGAAPNSHFSVFLGYLSAETAFESNLPIAIVFTR
jgi:hypothetical protein